MSLADIRREYLGQPLSESESEDDPFRQLSRWLTQARETEFDPTAMALATTTAAGRPSVRTVLLKDVDNRGLVFYTNYDSQKAHEIGATGLGSLLFYWPTVNRQVRVTGAVAQVSDAESDAYFASRPVESRWSVYASHQSDVVEDRHALEARFEAARKRYGDAVPRPSWWGGYRVVPDAFEFWQGRPSRLHDRLRYLRLTDDLWRRERLAP